ncbi:SDR family NAD(P)-dependent oxidoreductase [Acidomonas methanolica]|uniref:Oxidoreductase/short-chain dehydrogenase/reductase SDR n=1 Tax=Acidomonas methanolica NBRC 104435 TaxID=1231351 RepID=A0A023D383_ACIMT|nr:SDR family NAD(P)-dependent oxidoreductase [Acidomonas methanolica]MBU2654395.1 SDR family NAD(P)-dependent oxidoreductase [Acidomonas methanolica]TCS28484.1 3-hydroxy acid dehydrogenase/malonic semialdehyde reductase [Acidomonas methanolica]GAJ28628.1 oxidoreductase/short-chain dehydrogenase/reductase SDR [Acidomonas methanolica NBRC 104435]GBQ51607.1 oxidoreductase [Acidomonas methanolica]GEK99526.1 NADP-dependent 3-hydroxy acid dehydrogenase YdfG [Acidomonas methanolica NBRC 104435]
MAIILVTGATAGFGQAIARRCVADGHRVIATGRRAERLAALRDELGADHCLPVTLDMLDRPAVSALPETLPEAWREIDVLVNNAGLALGIGPAQDAEWADWETMIGTNVIGLAALTRAVLPGMVARDRGYVISIGSIAGTYAYKGGNVYGATKAFVRQFMMNLRTDLLGTRIRVTDIEPGLCGGSEFSNVRLRDDGRAAAVYKDTTPLTPEDIAETVSWLTGLPPHMNVNRIEMMPVCQAPAGLAVDRGLG